MVEFTRMASETVKVEDHRDVIIKNLTATVKKKRRVLV